MATRLMLDKWVSESILIVVTGLKKNTIKTAREKSWVEGREYKHSPLDVQSGESDKYLYNREAIDEWIERMPMAGPRRKKKPNTAEPT